MLIIILYFKNEYEDNINDDEFRKGMMYII